MNIRNLFFAFLFSFSYLGAMQEVEKQILERVLQGCAHGGDISEITRYEREGVECFNATLRQSGRIQANRFLDKNQIFCTYFARGVSKTLDAQFFWRLKELFSNKITTIENEEQAIY